MKYAGLKKNDATNCLSGICTSLWTQGCPHRCEGCHNPETWNENGGIDVPANIKEQIIQAISANGIQRDFSILGGEPLASWNRDWVLDILTTVKETYPNITVYLWTGWLLDDLMGIEDATIREILKQVDYLIDGKFDINYRDITLPLRGSRNQNIWKASARGSIWTNVTKKYK